MEDIHETEPTTTNLLHNTADTVVDTNMSPIKPTKKIGPTHLVVIGLLISFFLMVITTIALRFFQQKKTYLVINAPTTPIFTPSPSPTSTKETTTLITQEVLFEPKIYRNEKEGFEIKVPLGWSVDESKKSGAELVLVDPKATITNDGALLTFISISTGPADTLENETEKAKDNLSKLFNSYHVDESKALVMSGKSFYLLGGNYIAYNSIIKNRNLIHVQNNRGYAVSATAPETDWAKKEPLLNATLFSFKNF